VCQGLYIRTLKTVYTIQPVVKPVEQPVVEPAECVYNTMQPVVQLEQVVSRKRGLTVLLLHQYILLRLNVSFALYCVVYLYILCNSKTKLFLGFELINFTSRVKELKNFISEYHFFSEDLP